jgi:RNA polymerase sigma-70 factor (ECF subfamily)
MTEPPTPSAPSRQEWFLTTHWSLVLAARGDSLAATAALERLCQTYWYPLYAFVRRMGHSAHDAEDLVQGFFAVCLEKNYLGTASEAKGRFRSFLLLMLKRYMANEWDKAMRQKRGGGKCRISLDSLSAEQRYALEPSDQSSADRLFERRWAITLLGKVLVLVREEHMASGRLEAFEVLKCCLTGTTPAAPHSELAAQLGISEGAVKVAVHRLRARYRELLEEEIANTVASPDEVEEERLYLLRVLSG